MVTAMMPQLEMKVFEIVQRTESARSVRFIKPDGFQLPPRPVCNTNAKKAARAKSKSRLASPAARQRISWRSPNLSSPKFRHIKVFFTVYYTA
jgi:hypothetical protein